MGFPRKWFWRNERKEARKEAHHREVNCWKLIWTDKVVQFFVGDALPSWVKRDVERGRIKVDTVVGVWVYPKEEAHGKAKEGRAARPAVRQSR